MNFPAPLSGRDPLAIWLNRLLAASKASRVKQSADVRPSVGPEGTKLQVEAGGSKKKELVDTVTETLTGEAMDMALDGQGRVHIVGAWDVLNPFPSGHTDTESPYRIYSAILEPDLSLSKYCILANSDIYSVDCKTSTTLGSSRWWVAGAFTDIAYQARVVFHAFAENGRPLPRADDITSGPCFKVRYNSYNDKLYLTDPVVSGSYRALVEYDPSASSPAFIADRTPAAWGGTGSVNNLAFARHTPSLGKIYLCTSAATVSGKDIGLERVSATGVHDATFDPFWAADPGTRCVREYSGDGKVVCGGDVVGSGWSTIGSTNAGISKMHADGTEDTDFDPGDGFDTDSVEDIAIDAHGNILCVGDFSSYRGVARGGLARLNADGQLDTSFPDLDIGTAKPNRILIEPAGTILICGGFTVVGGKQRPVICRIDDNGTVLGED